MKYLAVLGRLTQISLAELEAQFGSSVRKIGPSLAVFDASTDPDINRLGGSLKLARLLEKTHTISAVASTLNELSPSGKIVLGFSDYSKNASSRTATSEAIKIKKSLMKLGRSVRVLANTSATLSTATAHHNQLGEKPGHFEILKVGSEYYLGLGVQNITAYAARDRARPARDARVGMLPPKLAQILINLCGPLPPQATILDPFCGTGVVLQEAALLGFCPLGSDLSEKMVEYSQKNLSWLLTGDFICRFPNITAALERNRDQLHPETQITPGDARSHTWPQGIAAVACEVYLGSPMSQPPADIKLRTEKQQCQDIILGFLENIHPQIAPGTPLALAVPAWLRPDGTYSRLKILDEIEKMGYNATKYRAADDLLYFREGQIVAREIIVLRKK